ncbi:MAG: RsiV family protein, partial [Lachnospiraceae bacterium]|nr:RsiV family protein [Lachnospiraceae bacterium]
YGGGAHGGSYLKNFHFDLQEGAFIGFNDLSNSPEELWSKIADEIVNEIYMGDSEMYYDNFYQVVHDRKDPNFSVTDAGLTFVFDQYEIAPYALGMPSFTIPYSKMVKLFNDRGMRVFEFKESDYIMADYYEATEYWGWFIGGAPVDYQDTKSDDEAYEYCAFKYKDIHTLADLKALLKIRFSDELIDRYLDIGLFKEFDGKLYVVSAGRGSDISVHHIDYDVEYTKGDPEGKIVAHIYRQDFTADSTEPVLTGEVDDEEICFTMGDNGAIFTAFPTLW